MAGPRDDSASLRIGLTKNRLNPSGGLTHPNKELLIIPRADAFHPVRQGMTFMPTLKILTYPDPILKGTSAPVETITEETRKRVEGEVRNIIEGFKALHLKMIKNEVDRQRILKTSRKLRRRFITVKKLAAFYSEWLNVNLSKTVMKPYPSIRKAKLLFEEKYGTVRT